MWDNTRSAGRLWTRERNYWEQDFMRFLNTMPKPMWRTLLLLSRHYWVTDFTDSRKRLWLTLLHSISKKSKQYIDRVPWGWFVHKQSFAFFQICTWQAWSGACNIIEILKVPEFFGSANLGIQGIKVRFFFFKI